MTVTTGSRIGPYEVTGRVGSGGMGEVFRARDTRIGRDVAIKVLPPEVASDPDRLRRFEQEARTVGSLSHPNLVTLHDFGTFEDAPYLVMELLEGETLREKLGDSTGAPRIPIRKAMDYGHQLAAGLAAAHEKGVIHRDLKPENIFVTRDGRLKILDFGLAKVSGTQFGGDNEATQARGTTPGTILGTVGYMSPEQVRGGETDQRTDIFACGAILYEMISGRKAFRGASSADAMSAILHEDPPELSSNSQQVSPVVDRLIRRCLEKEKTERFESARDLAFALDTMGGTSSSSHAGLAAPDERRPAPKRAITLAVLAAMVVAALVAAAWRAGRAGAANTGVAYRQLTFDAGLNGAPSVAPDGKTFAFVRGEAPHRQIFMQRTDGRSALLLSRGDDDDHDPAFSPDGTQIAFRSEREGGGIFVMGATGESVRRITSDGYHPAWTPDGSRLVFCSEEILSPTSRNSVSSLSVADVATGTVKTLFAGDAVQPEVSPHAKRIAYWALKPTGGQRDIYTIAMSGDPKSVVAATDDAPLDWTPVWAPDGKSILFGSDRGGTLNLWRLPIDEESGKPLGPPQPLSVPAMSTGRICVARNDGRILYASVMRTNELRRGTFDAAAQRVTFDPKPVLSGSMLLRSWEASSDGQWIALTTEERQEDVFVMKSDGTDLRQLTNDAARDRGVSWWPDNSRLAFYSARTGAYDLWSIRSDGSEPRQLTRGVQVNFPIVAPDGHRVAFTDLTAGRIVDVSATGPVPADKIERMPSIPGTNDGFYPRSWSPDGTRIIGTGWRTRKGLWMYSMAGRSLAPVRFRLDSGYDPLNAERASVQFVDDGHLLVASNDRHLYLVDLASGIGKVVGEGDPTSITMSRGGRYILALNRSAQSDVWELTTEGK